MIIRCRFCLFFLRVRAIFVKICERFFVLCAVATVVAVLRSLCAVQNSIHVVYIQIDIWLTGWLCFILLYFIYIFVSLFILRIFAIIFVKYMIYFLLRRALHFTRDLLVMWRGDCKRFEGTACMSTALIYCLRNFAFFVGFRCVRFSLYAGLKNFKTLTESEN